MPRILDNIDLELRPALRQAFDVSDHADVFAAFMNLRGWQALEWPIDQWAGGSGRQCRLVIGMQQLKLPEGASSQDYVKTRDLLTRANRTSNRAISRLKRRLVKDFLWRLLNGLSAYQGPLIRFSKQLASKKVVVKLFLRHPLHAKLYLCFRPDPIVPCVAFLGSSNLSESGLSTQGELNISIVDQDATKKLALWFEHRWNDPLCVDITKELLEALRNKNAATE